MGPAGFTPAVPSLNRRPHPTSGAEQSFHLSAL